MIYFLLILLAGIGITNLVVNASLFDNLRDFVIKESDFLGKLITCMMCSGFWVGFVLGLFGDINPIYLGASISLLSFLVGIISNYFEILTALKASELQNLDEEK
jgi:hypothetical protein